MDSRTASSVNFFQLPVRNCLALRHTFLDRRVKESLLLSRSMRIGRTFRVMKMRSYHSSLTYRPLSPTLRNCFISRMVSLTHFSHNCLPSSSVGASVSCLLMRSMVGSNVSSQVHASSRLVSLSQNSKPPKEAAGRSDGCCGGRWASGSCGR